MTHTPTPWEAVSNESYWTIVPETRGKNDPYQIGDVCSSYPSDKDQGLQQANAAHIVKCVNMHEELVEALKEIHDWFMADDAHPGSMIGRARETLKKAGAL